MNNQGQQTCQSCQEKKLTCQFSKGNLICGWCLLDMDNEIFDKQIEDWVLFDQERKIINLSLMLISARKRYHEMIA